MDAFHSQLIERDKRTSDLALGGIIADLNRYTRPVPLIFWLDFLGSVLMADGFIYFAARKAAFSPGQLASIFIAAIFLFRAAVFLHEAMHLGKRLPYFQAGYNLLFGFVHKLPLYTYHPHRYHHAVETYGTKDDPEYELLKGSPLHFVIPIFSQAVTPLLLLVRFGIVPALLPFIGEKGRNAVYQYASTFVLNFRYKRALPDKEERREWYGEEAACFIYNAVFFALMLSGVWGWNVLFIWYATMYLAFLFNFYRVMTSHSYSSNLNQTTRKLQILDTGTVTGTWALGWLYPLGQRYHALHHLFPHVPYHNLAKLHRALLGSISPDHPYRETLSPTYIGALRRLPGA